MNMLSSSSSAPGTMPAPMIALTLALYVTVYLALIVAYVGVLKYMAEHPAGPGSTAPAPGKPTAPHAA
mgnify:CR=1 FL=1